MNRVANREYEALLLMPLAKSPENPDTILLYGNPAQVMRLVQAYSYVAGERVSGHFGGKVECDEYIIAPFKTGKPRVAIPGMGDRIFSMTQDDEMVFALPGQDLETLLQGLERGRQQNRGPLPGYLLPGLPAGISQISYGVGEGVGVVLKLSQSIVGAGFPRPWLPIIAKKFWESASRRNWVRKGLLRQL